MYIDAVVKNKNINQFNIDYIVAFIHYTTSGSQMQGRNQSPWWSIQLQFSFALLWNTDRFALPHILEKHTSKIKQVKILNKGDTKLFVYLNITIIEKSTWSL